MYGKRYRNCVKADEDIQQRIYNKIAEKTAKKYRGVLQNSLPFPNDPSSVMLPISPATQVNSDFKITDRYFINLSDEEFEKLKASGVVKTAEERNADFKSPE